MTFGILIYLKNLISGAGDIKFLVPNLNIIPQLVINRQKQRQKNMIALLCSNWCQIIAFSL